MREREGECELASAFSCSPLCIRLPNVVVLLLLVVFRIAAVPSPNLRTRVAEFQTTIISTKEQSKVFFITTNMSEAFLVVLFVEHMSPNQIGYLMKNSKILLSYHHLF